MIIKKKKTISYLVSGRGSNFQAVAEQVTNGYIYAKNGLLITDNNNSRALLIAKKLNIQAIYINPKEFNSKLDYEKEMINQLEIAKTDLIIAAGYMRILSPYFIQHYLYKIINIHPSLLPSFPGKNAQQQALDKGVKITGCTTHFIDEGIDTGHIILQASVEVNKDDNINSLSSKILRKEHIILTESAKLFCENKIVIKHNKLYILD